MSNAFSTHTTDGIEDLVPWADPYIAALIEKLRHADETDTGTNGELSGELPPPLDNNDEDSDNSPQIDWSSRWPQH